MKTIVLTMAELKRVEVIQRVFRGEVTMAEAAMVLGVTERHSYRIKACREKIRHRFSGPRGSPLLASDASTDIEAEGREERPRG